MSNPPNPNVPIVARAGRYYRNARYILAAGLFAFGLWSVRDGFYLWPAENIEALKLHQSIPHNDVGLFFNRAMAFGLPLAALGMVLWLRHNSRGEFRLENDTLHVPGHPPIPLASIESLDKTLWERKGVARLTYATDDGKTADVKLDDFVYQQEPMQAIVDRIEKHLQGG